MSPDDASEHDHAQHAPPPPGSSPLQLSLLDLLGASEGAAETATKAKQTASAPVAEVAPTRPACVAIRTLSDVMAELEIRGTKAEGPSQKHYLSHQRSALRTLAAVLHRSLNDIPADPRDLRRWIADAPYLAGGVSAQRWSRVQTLTLAALHGCGISTLPGRSRKGPNAEWRKLMDKLPSRTVRHGISRFASFCSRSDVLPQHVTEESFSAFRLALEEGSLNKNVSRIYRDTVRLWNEAVRRSDGWPAAAIPLERHRRFYSQDWASFPPSLRSDLDAFLAARSDTDEFSRGPRGGAIRTSTVGNYRRTTLRLASLMVLSGLAPAAIDGLAFLGAYENVERAMRTLQARRGGKKGIADGAFAQLASQFAAWAHTGDEDDLRALARRLTKPQREMTTRNRDRLRQFDSRANVQVLLDLPDRIFAEGRGVGAGIREARRAAVALAIEILTVSPMRIANLTFLEHDRHLVALGHGRRRQTHVVIPGEETKDGKLWEAALPPRTLKLLEEFRVRHRPHLFAGPSPYLFPNEMGRRRSPIALSRSIALLVKRETGIVMHAHLFRHLAGKLHLNVKPSDIETVRRLLNHSSSVTTTRYYAQQDMAQAFQSYEETLEKLRNAKPSLNSSRPEAVQ